MNKNITLRAEALPWGQTKQFNAINKNLQVYLTISLELIKQN